MVADHLLQFRQLLVLVLYRGQKLCGLVGWHQEEVGLSG